MKIFGKHDANTISQLDEVAKHAKFTALMADGHHGYSMPIGGVAAFDNQVSVTGVGYDISCGNCAMQTGMQLRDLADSPDASFARLTEIGYEIQNSIAIGLGKANNSSSAPVNHPLFNSDAWYLIPDNFRSELREKARVQLGSCGSGNHYIDILQDEDGFLWVGTHFGSRALGHKIATAFINISQGGEWGDRGGKEGMCLLDLDTQAGRDYWELMTLAGKYAYAGRDWVCRQVIDILDAGPIVNVVHNNHNFAWKERHHFRNVVVVRKGATPAFGGQLGFVGGSMGDNAVILRGRDTFDEFTDEETVQIRQDQEDSLMSTVHGAGRVMSRTAATGRNRRGKFINEPRVDAEETQRWLENRNVLVFGAGLDEAPQAYRRLPDVLRAQGDTVEVLHQLRPLVVVMAPASYSSGGVPDNPFLYSEND